MELRLENGDYRPAAYGGAETVSGTDEIAQRCLMRLGSRKGGFLPLPEYGSRLHELCSMKRSQRGFYAKQFVYEALEPEKGVGVGEVTYSEAGDGVGLVTAVLSLGGEDVTLSVRV